MRKGIWIAGAAVGTAIGAFTGMAALAQQAAPAAPAPASVSFTVKTATGAAIGTGKVSQSASGKARGVVLRLELKGLTPGWHGVHFHNKADCSAADLASAGPHIHTAEPGVHGLLVANANDSGDLPNIFAGADGTASAELFSPFVILAPAAGDDRPALQDADGSAVIVHAGPDDHVTSPSGGSGARFACGLITK